MEILNRVSAQQFSKVRMVGDGVNEILHISQALERAEDRGLDLVVVNRDSAPPVVRVQDFKKLEYEKKKARKASKGTSSTLKEMQFKVNISDHDLKTKINQIEKFLQRGDKVRIMVKLKGRERESPERANQLVDRVSASLDCKVTRISGHSAMALFEPIRVVKKSGAKPGSEAAAK